MSTDVRRLLTNAALEGLRAGSAVAAAEGAQPAIGAAHDCKTS